MVENNINDNIIISSVVGGVEFPEADLEMVSLEKDRILSMKLKFPRLFIDQSSGVVIDILYIHFVVFEEDFWIFLGFCSGLLSIEVFVVDGSLIGIFGEIDVLWGLLAVLSLKFDVGRLVLIEIIEEVIFGMVD